jgi:aminopeptidase YwaD
MRRHVRSGVVFLVLLAGCANHAAPRTASNTPGAGSVTEASVRAHLEFLASDALNGRGSGTRDEQIAAEYVGAQFRRLGFEPGGTAGGFVQIIDVERRTVAAPPALIVGTDAAPRARWTHGKEILVGGIARETVGGALQRIDVKATPDPAVTPGAAVFLVNGTAQDAGALFRKGAAVILTRETAQLRARWQTPRPVGLPRILNGISEQPDRASTITLSNDAADALQAMAEGTPIRLDFRANAEPERGQTYNAVGLLRGTDPSGDAILITSHLDHLGRRDTTPGPDKIFNGADDDASGTVAVMEVAEALARRGRPKRTVIFASFGSEETGGAGAAYLLAKPPVPIEKMVANVEFEMIGRPDAAVPAHTLWLTGYERSDLGAQLAAHGARLVQDPHPDQNFFSRSDNITLARRGVVAHTVSSFGLHTDYHRVSDETRTIDYAHMTESIASMVGPLWWLANSTFKPAWKPGLRP